jgi:FtsZ-interacting cell division protein ZipA
MEIIDTQTWIIMAAVIVLALVAVGAWFYRKKQSHRLRERFGPEYDRTVSTSNSRTKGESELKAREKRVERLDLTSAGAAGSCPIQRSLERSAGPIRR